jgi:hypothetical protein
VVGSNGIAHLVSIKFGWRTKVSANNAYQGITFEIGELELAFSIGLLVYLLTNKFFFFW